MSVLRQPPTQYQASLLLVERILTRHLRPEYRVTIECSYDQSCTPQKIEYLVISRGSEFVAYVFRGYSDPNTFHFVASRKCYGEYHTRIYIWDLLREGVSELERVQWWMETDEEVVDIYTL